ncbi:hypothetical protein OG625_27395 [Streptomyces sp. NBC_01351]|uniref:hypothetical protein n=1 Tax=Streptomyces sp. NBC_01351 TaxID=2903833 RepID=UPI002E3277F5|nr:hypothetical protein [Streptomyces sp. NBC_01351]
MGGRQYTQRGRRGRPPLRRAVRPAAFWGLAGALVAVLFLCARPVGGEHVVEAETRAHAVCVSPYDMPGCSPLAHAMPGVLPAPQPAAMPAAGEPAAPARSVGAGSTRPPEPLARAPDLHVLQVLRT